MNPRKLEYKCLVRSYTANQGQAMPCAHLRICCGCCCCCFRQRLASHEDEVDPNQIAFTMAFDLDQVCKVKVKVSHSLIAVGAVGVRVLLYLGHS